MVQLWVNLPAEHKMTRPGYQAILNKDIPTVSLPNQAGVARIIAGDLAGSEGPARTFTPMNIWDMRFVQGGFGTIQQPDGWTAALVVLQGTIEVNGDTIAREGQLVSLDRSGTDISIEANNDAIVLLLAGEPIDEPVVGQGPFVMNTHDEIIKAIDDFNQGRFGEVPA
jgi:redox-sensitive bicupin YhaK (pirin superfamily)